MINLVKGQNANIELNKFHIGLGWDVREDDTSSYDFDLDVSAFMITKDKKILTDDYLVFYNSEKRVRPDNLSRIVSASEWSDNAAVRKESRPVSPDLSVIGSIDDEDGSVSDDGDDETMDIDLSKVNSSIEEIVVCVSIYEYQKRNQNFGQVEHAYVRIYKPGQADGEGEYVFDLTEDYSVCASVEFCRLYRHGGSWKIQALGIGHKGGLDELVAKYV